jgi:hypothetical protein
VNSDQPLLASAFAKQEKKEVSSDADSKSTVPLKESTNSKLLAASNYSPVNSEISKEQAPRFHTFYFEANIASSLPGDESDGSEEEEFEEEMETEGPNDTETLYYPTDALNSESTFEAPVQQSMEIGDATVFSN